MNAYVLRPVIEARLTDLEREIRHLRSGREALEASSAVRAVSALSAARHEPASTIPLDRYGRPPWQRQS